MQIAATHVGLPNLATDRAFLDALCRTKHGPLLEHEAVALVLEYQWQSRHFKVCMAQLVLYAVLLACFRCVRRHRRRRHRCRRW